MTAQSPGAYTVSVVLHAGIVLMVLLFSYAASGVDKDVPKVFELVAGPGDNYAATAAPALGSPGGIKVAAALDRATPAPPRPATPRPTSAPSPIQPAPEAKPKKAPDLVADLKRVEARREARLEAKYKKQEEAEKKRMTQEEFKKEQAAGRVSHIDAEGIREGVVGGSSENKTGGAGGRALTRQEGSLLDAYFAELKQEIKKNHVPPEGVSDSLVAHVEFLVAADGSISNVRIARSSGNSEFDRSVIEACERTQSIGARPDGRSETVQMAFKMHEDESP